MTATSGVRKSMLFVIVFILVSVHFSSAIASYTMMCIVSLSFFNNYWQLV